MRPRLPSICLCLLIVSTVRFACGRAAPFELKDGDRVAFIGGTFVEREQNYSYLETLLRTRWPDRKITFRNLGWSRRHRLRRTAAATSRAPSRASRGSTKIVHELKPTVIFIGYGMSESFDGEAGLPRVPRGARAHARHAEGPERAETVLIGPIRHENLGPPLPDPAEHNRGCGSTRTR